MVEVDEESMMCGWITDRGEDFYRIGYHRHSDILNEDIDIGYGHEAAFELGYVRYCLSWDCTWLALQSTDKALSNTLVQRAVMRLVKRVELGEIVWSEVEDPSCVEYDPELKSQENEVFTMPMGRGHFIAFLTEDKR